MVKHSEDWKFKPLLLCDSVSMSVAYCSNKTAIAWKTNSTKNLMYHYMGEAHGSFLPVLLNEKNKNSKFLDFFYIKGEIQSSKKLKIPSKCFKNIEPF